MFVEAGWERAREIGVPILREIGIVSARKILPGHWLCNMNGDQGGDYRVSGR
jgi:hypothetical protein